MKKQPPKKGKSSASMGKRDAKRNLTKPNTNKKQPRTTVKQKLVLQALRDFSGNISSTCEACGISRWTFYDWMDRYPDFKEAVEDVEAKNVDNVESALLKDALGSGNVTAKVVYLKLKSKHARNALNNKPDTEGPSGDSFPDPDALIKAMDLITEFQVNSQ